MVFVVFSFRKKQKKIILRTRLIGSRTQFHGLMIKPDDIDRMCYRLEWQSSFHVAGLI